MELLESLYGILTSFIPPVVIWAVLAFFIIKKFSDAVFTLIRLIFIMTLFVLIVFNTFGIRDMILDWAMSFSWF